MEVAWRSPAQTLTSENGACGMFSFFRCSCISFTCVEDINKLTNWLIAFSSSDINKNIDSWQTIGCPRHWVLVKRNETWAPPCALARPSLRFFWMVPASRACCVELRIDWEWTNENFILNGLLYHLIYSDWKSGLDWTGVGCTDPDVSRAILWGPVCCLVKAWCCNGGWFLHGLWRTCSRLDRRSILCQSIFFIPQAEGSCLSHVKRIWCSWVGASSCVLITFTCYVCLPLSKSPRLAWTWSSTIRGRSTKGLPSRTCWSTRRWNYSSETPPLYMGLVLRVVNVHTGVQHITLEGYFGDHQGIGWLQRPDRTPERLQHSVWYSALLYNAQVVSRGGSVRTAFSEGLGSQARRDTQEASANLSSCCQLCYKKKLCL